MINVRDTSFSVAGYAGMIKDDLSQELKSQNDDYGSVAFVSKYTQQCQSRCFFATELF